MALARNTSRSTYIWGIILHMRAAPTKSILHITVECVFYMFDVAVRHEHFHDVEAHRRAEIHVAFDVFSGDAAYLSLFAVIHGFGGSPEFLGCARFYFHEHQTIAVRKDQIYLTNFGSVIALDEAIALFPKVLFRQALARFSDRFVKTLAHTKCPMKERRCMGQGPYFFRAAMCAAVP